MPYFIYRAVRFRHLEMADEAPSYDQALARAKALRARPDGRVNSTVKVIFAETEHQVSTPGENLSVLAAVNCTP